MLLDTIAEPILGVSAEVLLDGSLEEVCKNFNLIVVYCIHIVVFNIVGVCFYLGWRSWRLACCY